MQKRPWPRVGRRGFLGISAATIAGAATGAVLSRGERGRLEWAVSEAFPDREIALSCTLPNSAPVRTARVLVDLEAPGETLTFDAGEAQIGPGTRVFKLTLRYPYDDRVPGEYRYTARLETVDGLALETAEPARYGVRDIVWFA